MLFHARYSTRMDCAASTVVERRRVICGHVSCPGFVDVAADPTDAFAFCS